MIFLQDLCTILSCFSRLSLFYLLVVIYGLLSLYFFLYLARYVSAGLLENNSSLKLLTIFII